MTENKTFHTFMTEVTHIYDWSITLLWPKFHTFMTEVRLIVNNITSHIYDRSYTHLWPKLHTFMTEVTHIYDWIKFANPYK